MTRITPLEVVGVVTSREPHPFRDSPGEHRFTVTVLPLSSPPTAFSCRVSSGSHYGVVDCPALGDRFIITLSPEG